MIGMGAWQKRSAGLFMFQRRVKTLDDSSCTSGPVPSGQKNGLGACPSNGEYADGEHPLALRGESSGRNGDENRKASLFLW